MHVESTTTAGRSRSFALQPVWFLRFAALELFALWVIVATGAAVRLTSSGLGCRHWPGCEAGHPLPAKNYHAYIEFGNRVVGGVTILITLLVAVAAFWTPLGRRAKQLAVALFVGTLAQAPLGYLAVKTDLRWPVVAAHLLLSMVLLAGAVVLVFLAYEGIAGRAGPIVPHELRLFGTGVAVAGLALVVSGALATAAGPHSGGGTTQVHRLARFEPVLYAHAGVVAVFGCSFLFLLGYLAARRSRSPRLFAAALAVLAVLLLQVGLGELQYRLHLPWYLVLLHVAVAATAWAGIVALTFAFWRPPAWLASGHA
ncbi:MAG: COX15/CtaA family protein [Actinomycetota bacterium]|nr:COX15/CtaA family protein [Actinomycetota bacterium]